MFAGRARWYFDGGGEQRSDRGAGERGRDQHEEPCRIAGRARPGRACELGETDRERAKCTSGSGDRVVDPEPAGAFTAAELAGEHRQFERGERSRLDYLSRERSEQCDADQYP